ncbi:MAG TPA: aromatic ring-hydroxylating dioxygenase subunit alpha [Candidatus Acidoferrales bacterium]|nr:aromatic ring-hydroxylating dioxygenase subunit alpha [Candidatus Acidoferrales bacterium]
MLSCEENEKLTRVGPGTPAGELLRRYWHPVAVAAELTEEKPIKAVKVLGEELVVFRDKSGRYGLLGERCAHRMASLAYGRTEPDGIRCPYHGWKFDVSGKCLEQPAEPPGSTFKERVRQKAYRVQKLSGLLYAYMGPEPAPLLPRWDVLVREDGRRWILKESIIDCNWLQAMENSVDPAHLFWLHGDSGHLGSHMKEYREQREFILFEYGIMKRRTTPGKNPGDPPMVDEHPLLFPTILRHVAKSKNGAIRHDLQIRVPVDDYRTQVFRVNFEPSESARSPEDEDPPFQYVPLKNHKGEYDMTLVAAQDSMAWETQGPITDRTQEHLGVSDEGVIMLRKLLSEQIDIVARGGEPMGVIRDPAKNRIIEIDVVNERIGLYRRRERADRAHERPAFELA